MTFGNRQIVFLSMACALIGMPKSVRSQEPTHLPSISIGSVQVSLGMPRGRAYQLFKNAHIDLRSTQERLTDPTSEMWLVCGAADKDPSDCDSQGMLIFKNGLLIQADLRWGVGDNSATALAESFIGAAHDLSKRGLTRCEIAVEDQDDPSLSVRRLQVECGPHYSIQLFIARNPNGQPTAEIQEILSENTRTVGSK